MSSVNVGVAFQGRLQYFEGGPRSRELCRHARELLCRYFGGIPDVPGSAALSDWIERASRAKTEFTNGSQTRELTEQLILERYAEVPRTMAVCYDRPRLRLIPQSDRLRSGISYNYLPHRDTWYGGAQEQINHWISVANVTGDSTFFIAPDLFSVRVSNTSADFHLEEWRVLYRDQAAKHVTHEARPHPMPTEPISDSLKIPQILAPDSEVCFSGHHIHGSLPNVTNLVRVSIDFRVAIPELASKAPPNLDSLARGDYYSEMIRHPAWRGGRL